METITIKELIDFLGKFKPEGCVYVKDIIDKDNTLFSITEMLTNNDTDVILNCTIDSELLNTKRMETTFKLPEPAIEEKALNDIRIQKDYIEEKFFYDKDKFEKINYIIESSKTLNKSVKTTFLYNENGGGAGSKIEII